LVIPHNLIHKYKHVLLDKSFKVLISKKKQRTYIIKIKIQNVFLKTHELKEFENIYIRGGGGGGEQKKQTTPLTRGRGRPPKPK
jgi:hypothetical protein